MVPNLWCGTCLGLSFPEAPAGLANGEGFREHKFKTSKGQMVEHSGINISFRNHMEKITELREQYDPYVNRDRQAWT